jgi:DNA-binding MarR family transcriptional regulator
MDNLKLSPAGLRVVRYFCDDPARQWSGTELSKKTGLGSGTLYPLLAKLEKAGWLPEKRADRAADITSSLRSALAPAATRWLISRSRT